MCTPSLRIFSVFHIVNSLCFLFVFHLERSKHNAVQTVYRHFKGPSLCRLPSHFTPNQLKPLIQSRNLEIAGFEVSWQENPWTRIENSMSSFSRKLNARSFHIAFLCVHQRTSSRNRSFLRSLFHYIFHSCDRSNRDVKFKNVPKLHSNHYQSSMIYHSKSHLDIFPVITLLERLGRHVTQGCPYCINNE